MFMGMIENKLTSSLSRYRVDILLRCVSRLPLAKYGTYVVYRYILTIKAYPEKISRKILKSF